MTVLQVSTGELSADDLIKLAAAMAKVREADVRGFLLIVHTHGEDEECNGQMSAVTDSSPGGSRAMAVGYIRQIAGMDS